MNATDTAIEAAAAAAILDRGMRYTVGEQTVTLRPLRWGALLHLSGEVAASGLTLAEIDTADQFDLFARHSELVLRCVAIAELNDPTVLDDAAIQARVAYYKAHLHALQVYELFAQVIGLSGIQNFTTTIRLLLTMKTSHLSPSVKGS